MLIIASKSRASLTLVSEFYRPENITTRFYTEATPNLVSKPEHSSSDRDLIIPFNVESQTKVAEAKDISKHLNDLNNTITVDNSENAFDELDLNFSRDIVNSGDTGDLSSSNNSEDFRSSHDISDGFSSSNADSGGGGSSGSGAAAGATMPHKALGPRDTDGFDIPETLAIVDECIDISNFAQYSFEEFCRAKAKYVVPDELFSHFKSKTRAARAAASANLYEIYKFRESLQIKYIEAIVDLSSRFMPVTRKHIREIDRCFINKSVNLSSPMSFLEPYINYFCGSAIYGSALGLYDMIFFEPCGWETIELRYSYDASTLKVAEGNKLISLVITCTDLRGKKHMFSYTDSLRLFSCETFVEWSKTHFEQSLFANKNPKTIIGKCFSSELVDPFKVSVYDSSTTERVGIVTRSFGGTESIVDGFRVHQVIVSDLDIDEFNEDLTRILATTKLLSPAPSIDGNMGGLSLDIVGDNSDKPMKGYCAYLSAVLYQFVYQRVASERTSVIKKIDFTIKLTPHIRSKSDSDNCYNDMVDRGAIVPISPLQILRYLGFYNMDVWRKYVFCSALVGMNLNPIILTVMPMMPSNSKRNMVLLSIYRDRLSSDFYDEEESLDFERSHRFAISYSLFLKEMLVRMLISSDTPSYFRFMSEGSWKGSSGSSLTIVSSSLQNVFSKYTLNNVYKEVSDFNYIMALYNIRIEGVRRTARLVNKLPDVFSSIVESEEDN